MEENIEKPIDPKYRFRQHLCGGLFIGLYLLNIVFFMLKYFDIIAKEVSWYVGILGPASVVAFALLYTLASDSTSEIFAGCQIALTSFFSLILPVIIAASDHSVQYYVTLLCICIVFGALSIYLWTVLMSNGKFTREELRWIVFLPMPYIGYISCYYANIGRLIGASEFLVTWNEGNLVFPPLSWGVMLMSSVAFWKLCHSKAFSGPTDDISYPSWKPWNVYAGAYALALILVFLIY